MYPATKLPYWPSDRCERGHECPPCLSDELKKLSEYLRTGAIDEVLAEGIALRGAWLPHIMHPFVIERRKASLRTGSSSCFRIPTQSLKPAKADAGVVEQQPNLSIVEYLARVGLEEQLFAYISRFAGAFPEGLAAAFEFLQANLFNSRLYRILGKQTGLTPSSRLDWFRLTQRIRNEHGIQRENSPPDCFHSYEDIVDLERKIKCQDAMDFMFQCMALRLVDVRHVKALYESTSTFSQLCVLHEALPRHAGIEKWHGDCLFLEQFWRVGSQRPDPTFSWQEIRTYMRISHFIDTADKWTFNTQVMEEVPDEALNCLLNSLVRISGDRDDPYRRLCDRAIDIDEIIDFLQSLLANNASLVFRDADEDMSSLAAIVVLANRVTVEQSVLGLLPFSCCPLAYDGSKVSFDPTQPAPLLCLTARSIPLSEAGPGFPENQRPLLEAHHELQVLLGGRADDASMEVSPKKNSPLQPNGISD